MIVDGQHFHLLISPKLLCFTMPVCLWQCCIVSVFFGIVTSLGISINIITLVFTAWERDKDRCDLCLGCFSRGFIKCPVSEWTHWGSLIWPDALRSWPVIIRALFLCRNVILTHCRPHGRRGLLFVVFVFPLPPFSSVWCLLSATNSPQTLGAFLWLLNYFCFWSVGDHVSKDPVQRFFFCLFSTSLTVKLTNVFPLDTDISYYYNCKICTAFVAIAAQFARLVVLTLCYHWWYFFRWNSGGLYGDISMCAWVMYLCLHTVIWLRHMHFSQNLLPFRLVILLVIWNWGLLVVRAGYR